MTREEWLLLWIDVLRGEFGRAGFAVPEKIRVTCGFPARGGLAKKNRRVGECWGSKHSEDKTVEVFVSPLMDRDADVAETVAHEVGHAINPEDGHRAAWKKRVQAVGLTGERNQGPLGAQLTAALKTFVAKHGHYPHARLHEPICASKKQTTRMLKCVCAKCGYTCRTTAKWLALGTPICPKDKVAMAHDAADDAEDDE